MNLKEKIAKLIMEKDNKIIEDEFNLISSILNKEEIKKLLNDIFLRIGLNKIRSEISENIFKFILFSDFNYQEKIDVLKHLKNNSLINDEKITEDLEVLNFEEIFKQNEVFNKNKEFIISLGKYLFNINSFRYGQGSTTQGRGELFLTFFGNGKLADKGDIILNETFYEVKSNSGVIFSLLNVNSINNVVKTNLPYNKGVLSYKDLYEELEPSKIAFPSSFNKNNFFKFINELLEEYKKNPSEKLELFIKQFFHFIVTYRVGDEKIQKENFLYIEKLNNYIIKKRIKLQTALNLINRKLGILGFETYKKELGFDKILFFYKEEEKLFIKEISNPRRLRGLKFENIGFIKNGGRPYQVTLKIKKEK